VVEKLEVKRAVLQELEGRVTRSCILTTNTSSLSVDELAGALAHPERFLGMHFFNPVHKMPLVEIVRGKATSPLAIATVHALSIRLGKVPVVVADGPGFLVNRVLGPYLNEAGHLLGEGATVEQIDRVAIDFGMPMGPLRLVDEIGLDVVRHAGTILHQAFGERMAPAPALIALSDSGRLGRKSGLGFYRHEEGRKARVDTELGSVLGSMPEGEDGPPEAEEIRDRLVLALINEAARTLEDGIAASAADVDLAMVMGTGFPPFRGGLLLLADQRHARSLVDRLERMEGKNALRFQAAPLLRRLAREDRGFYDAFPQTGV
jgi:3-hydroxyacyl-CoA dehydrogenase / enoyl-CoA hydratase / 3-hydroxybutyryl-CoA epimerase